MAGDPPQPELSIVVPSFQESDGLRRLHAALVEVLDGEVDRWELILVDDGSPDETWERIVELTQEDPRVRGIRLSRNFGKEAAIAAGLERAVGRAAITMDADLQHPPAAIPEMLALWRAGSHVVDGVKRNRVGQGIVHRAISAIFNAVFSRATQVDLNNATDFKLLDRRALDGLAQLPERSNFYRGTAQWIGYERSRVEFDVDERSHGNSRWRIGALARLAITALTSFTAKPLHLVTLSGIAFGVFSVVLGAHTLFRFFQGEAVEGFTTLILLNLILGSFLLTGLGIIGEYLARIHDEVKGRPRYLVSDER